MQNKKNIEELEHLLNELKSQDETSVTVEEAAGRWKKPKVFTFGRFLRFFWKTKYLWIALIIISLLIALPFITLNYLTTGSTFMEKKGAVVERIVELNELATAESYTKVLVEREDNQLFGKDIGLNIPGTRRELLVVIPGTVKAGVDFSKVDSGDVDVNEKDKTLKLTLPAAEFLGDPSLDYEHVEIYSYEGLFRGEANIEEAYELAEDAKKLILEESAGQGLLQMAEENARTTVEEMFSITGYEVEIEFKEPDSNASIPQ